MSTHKIMSNNQASGSGSHDERIDKVLSSPTDQIGLYHKMSTHKIMSNNQASGSGSHDERVDMVISSPEDQTVEAENSSTVQKVNKDKTDFCLAAASGDLEVVKGMLMKNCELPLIMGEDYMYPIEMAARSGHKAMVELLYDSTKHHLEEDYLIRMFETLIRYGFYDFVVDLLETKPHLAMRTYGYFKETPLIIWARTFMMISSVDSQNQEGILKRSSDPCEFSELPVSGSNKLPAQKLHPQAREPFKRLLELLVKDLDDNQISEVIFLAASEGHVEFLRMIIRDYPSLILKAKERGYSIFHVAVLNRRKDIFELIHEINPSEKYLILQYKDYENNNILHLAGKLAPPDRFNTVSRVFFLQLQQELLWFEEVRKIVHPLDAEAKNREGKTPRALFAETHAALKEKAEQWMKGTANSCMIVATLITTVVFAAAFIVPGGTKEDTGTPLFIRKVSFITFVISDAVSLVSSTCSILIILSIHLNLRYTEEDFLWVLPRKLVLALLTLFISIAAMMVVFCATIFIVFRDGMIWVPMLVSVIASFPVILFTKHQRGFLFDAARSTYKIFSPFRSGERTSFDDKGKQTKRKKGKDLGCDACCHCRVRSCWY